MRRDERGCWNESKEKQVKNDTENKEKEGKQRWRDEGNERKKDTECIIASGPVGLLR